MSERVLTRSWAAFVLGTGFGFLGAAFTHPGVLAKMTAYALLLNVMGRSQLVPEIQPSAGVLGLLMLLTYWLLIAAAPAAFGVFNATNDDDSELADTVFADVMVHLVLPLDAAVAARYTDYNALRYTALLAGVYAVVFVAVDPYPDFGVGVAARAAMSVGGVVASLGAHAFLIYVSKRCGYRPRTQSIRVFMLRDLRRASDSTLARPCAATTSESVIGVRESRRTRGRQALPARSRPPHFR